MVNAVLIARGYKAQWEKIAALALTRSFGTEVTRRALSRRTDATSRMRPAGVSRQAAIRSVRNLAPAARPPHSLPEWHGPRHRFVPSTRWLLSPKALSGPTCSPCAYAFPHHSESTASEVSIQWAGRWRQRLLVVPLARSYELQELQTGCSLHEGTLEFSCDQQDRGRPM